MTNLDRINLIRERLTPCQLALRALLDHLAAEFLDCRAEAEALFEAFLDLEAAVGKATTPTALFDA